jgi:hypothetical protein
MSNIESEAEGGGTAGLPPVFLGLELSDSAPPRIAPSTIAPDTLTHH